MKRLKLLLLAGLLLALVPIALMRRAIVQYARSVIPYSEGASTPSLTFDIAQSAALFVGVRKFTDKTLAEVPYAADDAVDLAYAFAIGPNTQLVPPQRVVLALSGIPSKEKSRQRLNELTAAGAVVEKADQASLRSLLSKQAARAGSDGLFIVSFATHGFNENGVSYLLAASSVFRRPESTIPTATILDIAGSSPAKRSLIFIDACRERVMAASRTGLSEPLSVAPLIAAMSRFQGQVVFYAAAAGGYAYDDKNRGNGVFTGFVLDGLQCGAETDGGFVTVDTLSSYVDNHVAEWIRKYRHDPSVTAATQLSTDGSTKRMPLARCGGPPGRAVEPPATASADGSTVVARDRFGARLWQQEIRGHIHRVQVADLDDDRRNEVIVGVDGGDDAGKIIVFNAAGQPSWIGDTNLPRDDRTRTGRMTIRAFAIGNLFHRRVRHVVALSVDESGASPSRLSVYNPQGKLIAAYWHPGPLQHVEIASLTAYHAAKITVSGVNEHLRSTLHVTGGVSTVFMLDPKEIRGQAPPRNDNRERGTEMWYGVLLPPAQTIERLSVVDHDHDRRQDIAVTTSSHGVFHINFDGHLIAIEPGTQRAHFELIASK